MLKIVLCENGKFDETLEKVTLDVERPSCVDPFALGYSVLMQFFLLIVIIIVAYTV